MSDIAWARTPKQERSQRTLDALLDAVEACFEDGTIETISVAALAKRAGLSVGAFYRRFPSKEAALQAVHERFCDEAIATADVALSVKRWEGTHFFDLTAALVGFLADDYTARRGLRRALVLLNATDPQIAARSKQVSGHLAGRIHGILAAHREELEHDDLLIASEMVHRMLLSALDSWALWGDGSSTGRSIPRERFVAELAEALRRYLRVRDPSQSGAPQADPTPAAGPETEEKQQAK